MNWLRRNVTEDVYSDMEGEAGTVVCFHGNGGNGYAWADSGTDKGAFTEALIERGFSVVCPTARDDTWNDWSGSGNRDIQNVNRILDRLAARRPFFLVGHSNGGGFATRYAVFGNIRPSAIQYSNASGIENILKTGNYTFPTLFNYSPNDPIVAVKDVRQAVTTLTKRRQTVSAQDLSARYAAGGYAHEHEFVNTADTSGPWFLQMEAARQN